MSDLVGNPEDRFSHNEARIIHVPQVSIASSYLFWQHSLICLDPHIRHILREDLVMKTFLRPFFLCRGFKLEQLSVNVERTYTSIG